MHLFNVCSKGLHTRDRRLLLFMVFQGGFFLLISFSSSPKIPRDPERCFSYMRAHPKYIYTTSEHIWALQEVLAPSKGHGPAEVMQRKGPDPCQTPPSFPPSTPPQSQDRLQTEKLLMMQTQTHWGCTEKGFLIYTLAVSAPSLITRYSYTVVLGY